MEIDAIFSAVDDVYVSVDIDHISTDDSVIVPENVGELVILPKRRKCYDSLIIDE
ncbi:hypothetical protein F9B74_10105 [Pelistega sp. NLN82]|uniref:Uncharacterized protein n=1 Tax=Pelistega ratti TaxID=2652177 RepID=A0A6L9Y8D0_9BURK|nr:hypothetical protein [Pelistega ratti]NEN76649.1 hypothetical protein [Pelistega ratti]